MSVGRRTRILHVGKFYPPHMGGIETHLQVLCGALKEHVDVEVIVANDGREDVAEQVDGVKVTRVGTRFNLSTAPVCPGMARLIRESEADIIHLHWPNPATVLSYLGSRQRARLVVTYHSDIVRQKLMAKAFDPVLHRTLKRCAAIIATSPQYVETSPVLQAHRERCHVIPYGIPIKQFEQDDTELTASLRARFGQRIVISVGRLIYYKGFEHLVRAMGNVQGHLLIVGDGPLRANLEQIARENGVADRVTFLGEVQNQDVIPYYHAADVFALASTARSEAFGIVQLEAMACGVPVVNTRLASGVPYVSLDGVTGITVPPADSAALAAAINRLLDDPALRASYGEEGRRRVRTQFTAEVMAARTLELYQEIVNSPVS